MNNAPYIDPNSSLAWMADGRCRGIDPDTFFPNDGAGVIRAKKVCAECTVTGQCLDYALDNRIEQGVWGGTSERQRRRILKERAREVVTPVQLAS